MTQHRKRCSRDAGADDGSKQDEEARTDNYAPPASTTSDSEGEEWQIFPWDARREEGKYLRKKSPLAIKLMIKHSREAEHAAPCRRSTVGRSRTFADHIVSRR